MWVSVSSNGAEVGDKHAFRCLLSSNNSPAHVERWEFNQQQIKIDSRVKIEPAHVLNIQSVRVSDSGKYTCIARVNGHNVSASENLKVYGR